MIYLNNAGTTWPKPPEVQHALQNFGAASPEDWQNIMEEGIETVTRFFNISNPDRFLFTSGCSAALTIALTDFDWVEGDRILMSSMEHHALSRWFHKLQAEKNLTGTAIPRSENGPIDLEILEKELQQGARMVAISMACNVTGEVLPYEQVVSLAHQYGALCLLDGAQVAGIIPINIPAINPDFFVFAGHKGPMGHKGIGGLYIADGVTMICPSAACEIDPEDNAKGVFPSYCDAGSLNAMALAAMSSGIKYLESRGWEDLVQHREQLVARMIEGLTSTRGINILGHSELGKRTGAVAIHLEDQDHETVVSILWEKYKIICGSGFQCAPMAHQALGTEEKGCLRFSVGPFNTTQDINALILALNEICEG